MATKTGKKARKKTGKPRTALKGRGKKYGKLGQCQQVTKGKRCKKSATYDTGFKKLCSHHYYHGSMMSPDVKALW